MQGDVARLYTVEWFIQWTQDAVSVREEWSRMVPTLGLRFST